MVTERMNRKSMTEFDDFKRALEYLKASPWRRRSPSYDELAQKMGYRSPRTLAMVLKGQRPPSRIFILRLARPFDLTVSEIQYLELLAQKEKSKTTVGDDLLSQHVRSLRNGNFKPRKIKESELKIFSSWCSIVLRELSAHPLDDQNLSALVQRLRGKVSAKEIKLCLSALERGGFLKRDEHNHLCAASNEDFATPFDFPSAHIQKLHREMIGLSLEALTDFMITEREFLSHSLMFDPAQTRQAAITVREFCRNFNKVFHNPEAREVYQLNIQFFPITTPPVKT